jgi:hypothetical protein
MNYIASVTPTGQWSECIAWGSINARSMLRFNGSETMA